MSEITIDDLMQASTDYSYAKIGYKQLKEKFEKFAAQEQVKTGWRPIEQFPTDGEDYLCCDNLVPDGYQQVCYWKDGRLQVKNSVLSYRVDFFTHFTALPAPLESGNG